MANKRKKTEKRVMGEMEVRWKKGCMFTDAIVSADQAYSEINKIGRGNDGKVTAGDVVAYAESHTRSAMHKLIGLNGGWDDTRAAHLYRLDVARKILRSIEVKYSEKQREPVRAFSVDETSWVRGGAKHKPYRATEDIIRDDEARAALLQRALNELVAFQRKYRALNELAVVVREIDAFLDDYHSSNT